MQCVEAKRRRLPAAEPDYLAALPPEIVDDIISRLDIRDVVRTSALSHAWRRRWHSVRGLNLRFKSTAPAAAIASVLKRSAAPIRKLRVRIRRRWIRGAVRWLRLLPRKRVRSLDIDFKVKFGVDEKPSLEPTIFSCVDLTSLSLTSCAVPRPPPSFAGFPRLTKLFLSDITLPRRGGRQLEAMIAASPLLVDLSLSYVRIPLWKKRWFVRGPNLQFLRICTYDDNGCMIGELPQLEEAVIESIPGIRTEDLCKILEGVTHATTLEFDTHLDWFENPPEGFSVKFLNLRSLHLYASLDEMPSTSLVFSILRYAPNLEELEVEVDRDSDRQDLIDTGIVEGFANAQTSDGILPKLRDVLLHGIYCSSNEMWFIKFVLSKARSLELFCVNACPHGIMSYAEACIEMAKYKRASPLARLRPITEGQTPAFTGGGAGLPRRPPAGDRRRHHRLDIRDVIRTSALSHAWRRRWHSIRGLDLDFQSPIPPAAISSVLKRSAAPIRSLRLRIPSRSFRRAVGWLRLLPRERVQSLDLHFAVKFPHDKPNLDASIFSCKELTTLCLYSCIFPPPPQPPSFVGFPKLTKLSLMEIELPPRGERRL
uniref:F-box domain-containing protein n=1 Tax=Leersia perrieri TaxID=77586 RepID=A0A0D9X8N8_9ORYZ